MIQNQAFLLPKRPSMIDKNVFKYAVISQLLMPFSAFSEFFASKSIYHLSNDKLEDFLFLAIFIYSSCQI